MKQELSLFIPVYGMTTKFTKEFFFFLNGGTCHIIIITLDGLSCSGRFYQGLWFMLKPVLTKFIVSLVT